MKKYIATLIAASMLVMVGCSASGSVDAPADPTLQQAGSSLNVENLSATETITQIENLVFPSDDYTKDLGDSVFFADGEEILITQSGTYEFTGDYTKSTITVNVNKDTDDGTVYLVLNNANIVSAAGTPINIVEAMNVVIVLEGENSVTQGEIITADTEFPTAAIYSKADTVITGDGSLTVTTQYQDGINSRDDLIIDGASITANAVEDGIVGKDLLAISNATITVDAGKDGLKSSNAEDLEKGNLIIASGNFNIVAENDAISSENILQIDDGNFELYSGDGYVEVIKTAAPMGDMGGGDMGGMGGGAGGGMGGMGGMGGDRGEQSRDLNTNDANATLDQSQTPPVIDEGFAQNGFNMSDENDEPILEESMKALKAVNGLAINGGTFYISSYEDAIHCDGDVNINGGDFTISAGDDGIHAYNTTYIAGGTINIENCFEGIEGIIVSLVGGDIYVNSADDGINANDRSGGVTIAGGNIEIYSGEGGDGIDSNGAFTQTGGDILIVADISADNAMNSALDVDGTVVMSGGTIVDQNGDTIEATRMGGMTPGSQGGTGGMRPEDLEGYIPSDTMPDGFEGAMPGGDMSEGSNGGMPPQGTLGGRGEQASE